MLKKSIATIALGVLFSVSANATETHIIVDGEATGGTGALSALAPPGTPITGPIRVDVLRGVTVGPANILSIDLSVGGNCFTTESPVMCPPGDAIVPITSIDAANFSVDVGSDTGTLEFTAFSPAFQVDIPVSIDLDTNTLSAGGALGSVVATIDFAVDSDGDGDLDLSDPDDDNDGVSDALDTNPVVANNQCNGGDSDDATLVEIIIEDRMCAANVSLDVQGGTQVLGPDGNLRVIAPFIWFQSGFSAVKMSVFAEDPCEGC